jgi:hypothetical protein
MHFGAGRQHDFLLGLRGENKECKDICSFFVYSLGLESIVCVQNRASDPTVFIWVNSAGFSGNASVSHECIFLTKWSETSALSLCVRCCLGLRVKREILLQDVNNET